MKLLLHLINLKNSKTSLKQFQWFFSSMLFIFLTGAVHVFQAEAEKTQPFICEHKNVIDYINSLIAFDRDSMNYYLDLLQKKTLTQKQKTDMLTILMQYHLIPLDETNTKQCQYYQYLCFSSSNTVHHYAERYLQKYPEGHQFCYTDKNSNGQRLSILSSFCRQEIQKRIQTIPYPLAIAQAVLESGWGQSDFSQNNKNYFGLQTVFSSSKQVNSNEQCQAAKRNSNNCVYHFESAETGFFMYSQILNSRPAYQTLRNIRDQKNPELNNQPCEMALQMAEGLKSYAIDSSYVKKIKSVIKRVCNIVNQC